MGDRSVVLFADDEVADVNGFFEPLREHGLECDYVPTLDGALDWARKRNGTVLKGVVTDLMFPRDPAEGLRFISDIRAGRTAFPEDIPLVALSGNATAQVRSQATQCGADVFVAKAQPAEEILDTILVTVVGEQLLSQVTCEVTDISSDGSTCAVQVEDKGTILYKLVPARLVPMRARVPGGCFVLSSYFAYHKGEPEVRVRAQGVDAAEDKEVLELLGDLAERTREWCK